jgi:hypothetical protein
MELNKIESGLTGEDVIYVVTYDEVPGPEA